jgi:hypothetical protein
MPLCPQITNTPITVTQTSDFTVTSVIPAVSDTLDGLAQDFANIIVDLDGKTKAYYQTTAPTGANEGDIWFDTDDGNKQYFYTGTAWVSVQDTAIAAAQAAATAAQTTADGKNRIYRQTTQPTGGTYVEGDLWFDTDDDNRIYRFTSGSWGTTVPLGNNALGNLSANKITSGTIDASVITVSNINAGNISTGTLSADRIASASITGTKIAAGTITASNIATGTITATQIAAGTITATQIAASTITATQINSLNGATIGGWTISSTALSIPSIGNAINSDGSANFSRVQTNTSLTSTFGGAINVLDNISASGTLTISSTSNLNGTVFMPNINSTTNAANVRWGTAGGGQIFYVTSSSQRFKEDIVTLTDVTELDPKSLLTLPVRAFRYKNDYLDPNDDRAEVLIPGFIAEEVDAVYPIAADYDENGPVSWNDRLMIPGLLALVQDLYKEIKQLKGE